MKGWAKESVLVPTEVLLLLGRLDTMPRNWRAWVSIQITEDIGDAAAAREEKRDEIAVGVAIGTGSEDIADIATTATVTIAMATDVDLGPGRLPMTGITGGGDRIRDQRVETGKEETSTGDPDDRNLTSLQIAVDIVLTEGRGTTTTLDGISFLAKHLNVIGISTPDWRWRCCCGEP